MTRRRLFGRCVAAALAAAGALAFGAPAVAGPDSPLSPAERASVYDILRGGAEIGDTPATGLSDESLWTALVRRATTELGLRVRPSAVDPDWALAPRPRQVEAEAQAAHAEGRLGAWLAGLTPRAPRYRALEALRVRYLRIVAAGGWPPVPRGPTLRLGATGPAVAAVRARLVAEGYAAAAPGEVFDATLERVLIEFQRRHALKPDGAVGAQTLAALNISAGDRLAQIDANLERWRWLPPLPAERVEVDAGGAEATLFADDAPRLSMRVIVGDVRHKTPMFASKLESVVFNPPWNVPASIAAQELLPRERAHPGYLARNDFIFVERGLQQRPGPLNALGRLKFDFPSPFGVYLHDTPSRLAFALPARWRSHGCIRLEKPRELAAAALAPQGWTAESIDAAIEGGETSRVALSKTIPLYVLYWTVVVGDDGQAEFRPDTYGWDAKLTRALAGAAPGGVKLARADSECAAAKAPQPVV